VNAVATKLGVYLRLGRVSNLPTVWSNVLAGVVLAGGAPEPRRFLVLWTALSCFYVGGMFLNDAFDREHDARVRPERPIPLGQIGPAEVYGAGYLLLAAGIALLAAEAFVFGGRRSWDPAGAGALLAAAIVLYDAWHKGNRLSPLLMGVCRMLVYVTAALSVAPGPNASVVAASAILLSYLIGLTAVAKQENLRELRNLWPLAFLAAPFVYAAPLAARSVAGIAAYVALLAWVCAAIHPLVAPKKNIGKAVVRLIAGISLVDALFVAGAGRPGGALVAFVCFATTLAAQRYVKGT
jgi:4-hydroxybenzoate polyprenyltransferase